MKKYLCGDLDTTIPVLDCVYIKETNTNAISNHQIVCEENLRYDFQRYAY